VTATPRSPFGSTALRSASLPGAHPNLGRMGTVTGGGPVGEVIGGLLPLALGVAVSPFPIITAGVPARRPAQPAAGRRAM
jgi:hypothetical protein